MVYLCRALSECEPKAKHELSANDTCALNEHERKRRANLVQQVYVEYLVNASRRRSMNLVRTIPVHLMSTSESEERI